MQKLPRTFYLRDSLTVAKDLLGKYLVHVSPEGKTVGKIVETEAYRGPMDAAAHSYSGKLTKRTQIMFGPGGYAYVFLIYGMYWCFNVVTGPENSPEVVLVRALEPISGIELMQQRRCTTKLTNLCSGPGKLCTAMGISKDQYGVDLCGDSLYLLSGEYVAEEDIAATPRINVSYAGEAASYPWRFIIKNSPFVSVKS